MGIMLDTPDQIAAYRKLAIYHALRLEDATGLRHSRGSVLKLAQQTYGVTARTKKGAIAELKQQLQDEGVLL
jgi:hypothetical protein